MFFGGAVLIKSTFYNLPYEKRRRVSQAIVCEFADASDEKISINRIVKRAGISRGSFYQYFDDKVDLIEVLLKRFIELIIEDLNKVVKDSNGDVFYIYEELFNIVTSFSENETYRVVLRRLVRNLRTNNDLVSEFIFNRFKGLSEFRGSFRKFSRDGLRYRDNHDYELLTQILNGILKNAAFNYYVMEQPLETVRSDYKRKLEILKTGAVF